MRKNILALSLAALIGGLCFAGVASAAPASFEVSPSQSVASIGAGSADQAVATAMAVTASAATKADYVLRVQEPSAPGLQARVDQRSDQGGMLHMAFRPVGRSPGGAYLDNWRR